MIEIMMKSIATYRSSLAEAMKGIRSFKTFAFAAASDFRNIASVAPSSRHLARAMLEGVPISGVRTVVELGAGAGAITRVLLKSLQPQATLLAFEINPEFISYLQESFSDPRLVLLNARAESLGALGTYEGAVIMVTHDEGAVQALSPERVILLPDGDEDLWSEQYLDLVSLA